MPKARQTCTRCSMRRQKCDKKEPCGRCMQAGEADSCSRTWVGGYDARVHRTYPKGGAANLHHRRPSGQYLSTPPRRGSDGSSLRHSSSDPDSDEGTSSRRNHRHQRSSTGISSFTSDPQTALYAEAMFARSGTNPNYPDMYLEDDIRDQNNQSKFRDQEIRFLSGLLPTDGQVLQMVGYHEDYLQWIHGCVHGPTFRKEVVRALQRGNGRIPMHELDMRWCALLFAVLTVTLTCAPASEQAKWNYDRSQKTTLSKKWYEAAVECLVLGDFNSKPHPQSVQAIEVLALSSHILGLSHRQFIMSGTALRIAQSLGLQRLSYEAEEPASQVSEETVLSREIGRRVWWNLVLYDWFSLGTYEMHSIQPRQFTTPRPRSYESRIKSREPESHPEAEADYCNHMLDIATVLLESHTSTSACIDPTLSYQQILKYDARLRELGVKGFQSWDRSAPWLRWGKELTRSAIGHKITILHRSFLVRSFRDPSFSYTRWASMEGSKIIIRECRDAFANPNRPVIYFEQAWLISAGITLCLDIKHRSEEELEYAEHVKLIEQAITSLGQCEDSVLASRGHRLLTTMLKERMINSRQDPGMWSNQQDGANVLAGFDSMLMNEVQGRELGCPSWSSVCASPRLDSVEREPIAQLPTPETDPCFFGEGIPESRQHKSLNAPAVSVSIAGDFFRNVPTTQAGMGANFDDLLAEPSWTDMISDFIPDSGSGAAPFGDPFSGQVPLYQ